MVRSLLFPPDEDLAGLSRRHGVGEVLAAFAVGAALRRDQPPQAWCAAFGPSGTPSDDLIERVAHLEEDLHPADALGVLHERLRTNGDRRRLGAVYTPRGIAERLVVEALADHHLPHSVCDPAVGGGAFLLAAARTLHGQGVAADEVVGRRLWGSDIDALAVAVTRVSLALWSLDHGDRPVWVPPAHLVAADPLARGLGTWPRRGQDGFDLVVGNPPFQGQLQTATVRPDRSADALAARAGLGRLGYADTAGLFLVLGCELAAPGGRVALIEPQSMLTARDAASVRRAVGERAELVGLWVDTDGVFDADVRVWAPIVERHAPGREARAATAPIRRSVGDAFRSAAPTSRPRRAGGSTWAPLVADLLGGPPLDVEHDLTASGRLSDRASATAGFRDQFYGLVPFVVEDEGPGGDVDPVRFAPLVTAGMIDPLHSRWGRQRSRFAGRSWTRPVVDLEALGRDNPRLSAWVRARLAPKVVVAPQTSVIEAVPDVAGRLVPSTPVVAVAPDDPGAVSMVAAVLTGPVASAWVFCQSAGSGLSEGALRVPARSLLQVPLPVDGDHWADGALHAAAAAEAAAADDPVGWLAAMDALGRSMTAAYGLPPDHPVVEWWVARRPGWR